MMPPLHQLTQLPRDAVQVGPAPHVGDRPPLQLQQEGGVHEEGHREAVPLQDRQHAVHRTDHAPLHRAAAAAQEQLVVEGEKEVPVLHAAAAK